ncbi:MAG: hypothetical protein WCP06_06770 [Verrucomicrobiota bacterium]
MELGIVEFGVVVLKDGRRHIGGATGEPLQAKSAESHYFITQRNQGKRINLEKAIGFRAKDAKFSKTELYEVGETLNGSLTR